MCSPARALLPRFESKHECLVPRRETAAKGRCSLPFTSCFGAQRQDQTPSQPLALSPASSQAPRAEGLTVTGSVMPLHLCRHSRLRTHTVASPCRLFPFLGSSCNSRDWRPRNGIKANQNKTQACMLGSSPLLLPCTRRRNPLPTLLPMRVQGLVEPSRITEHQHCCSVSLPGVGAPTSTHVSSQTSDTSVFGCIVQHRVSLQGDLILVRGSTAIMLALGHGSFWSDSSAV